MLTTAQRATLKADILATAALAQYVIDRRDDLIAEHYNALASPTFTLWKTAVSIDEIMRNGMDWARVDNLTVGKARIWDWLGRLGSFDASKANVRAGIDATWVGTAADLAVRAQVYVHCKRPALVIEKLFATGTGSDVVPAIAAYEGEVSVNEISMILNEA